MRWYSVFILSAFLGGRQVGRYVYAKTGRPLEDLDQLSTWVVCCALVGARLGEMFFYDFQYYASHPLEAILPVRFAPHFHFVGYQGLSYHGAILGSLLGTYVFANYDVALRLFPFRFRCKRQLRRGQGFLWLTTPVALGVMMGFFVRIGNFVNSEIVGTATQSSYGVLFVNSIVRELQEGVPAIESVKVHKSDRPAGDGRYQPITLEVLFHNFGFEEARVKRFLEEDVRPCLLYDSAVRRHVYAPEDAPLTYSLAKTGRHAYVAHIEAWGIPRHPVQLYESVAYAVTLALVLWGWRRNYKTLKDGAVAGIAMMVCYSLRFFCEFFKAPFNVLYDGALVLTTGHLLSALTVLGGLLLFVYAQRAKSAAHSA